MGIPRFISGWLNHQHFSFYQEVKDIHSLFLDFNFVLHSHSHEYFKNESATVEGCYQYVLDKTSQLIESINPRMLVISIDGVSPQAKICHQRQQRYLHDTDSLFNSKQITPCTNFMINFDEKIRIWLQTLRTEKIIYSSHLVPGEGEHKIVDLIRKGLLDPHKDSNHVIYTSDSDMIILSSLIPELKIFLLRKEGYFSIPKFREFLNKLHIPPTDFTIIISLLGNDYLPSPLALSQIDIALPKMIEIYLELNLPLSVEKTIQIPNFNRYLEILAEWEQYLLNLSSKTPDCFRHRLINRYISSKLSDYFRYQELRNSWYHEGEYPVPIPSIINDIAPCSISVSTVVELAANYFYGIQWMFEYYTKGTENLDLGWYYPKLYAPMLSDLSKIAKRKATFLATSYCHPFEQLLMVFPPKQRIFYPQILQDMIKLHPFSSELESSLDVYNFHCEEQGKVYLNDGRKPKPETKAVIPFVKQSIIQDYVKSLKIPLEIFSSYTAEIVYTENVIHNVLYSIPLTKEDLARIESWCRRKMLL